MNDLANYSHFHPSWEGRDFSKEEFASLLDDLTKKKPQETLLTNGKTIRIAGIATLIWQKIKGFLGLENQTDPIKVNYELLKLLRYGETHHFFSDAHIKELIQNLMNVLNQDANHSYSKVIDLIKSIFPLENDRQAAHLVDREIHLFYKNHQEQLQEPFWENLFHKYIAPIHQTTANVYFNEANIAYREGKFEKALKDISNALEINPENHLWLVAKANILLDYSKLCNPQDALALKQRALDILTSITEKEEEDLSLKGLNDLLIDTLNDLTTAPLEQANLDDIYIKLYEMTGKIEISDTIHAISIGEKIAAQRPDDWQIFHELSNLYQIVKNYPIAYKHLEKSHELNPANVEKQELLALYHLAYPENIEASNNQASMPPTNEFIYTKPSITSENSFFQNEEKITEFESPSVIKLEPIMDNKTPSIANSNLHEKEDITGNEELPMTDQESIIEYDILSTLKEDEKITNQESSLLNEIESILKPEIPSAARTESQEDEQVIQYEALEEPEFSSENEILPSIEPEIQEDEEDLIEIDPLPLEEPELIPEPETLSSLESEKQEEEKISELESNSIQESPQIKIAQEHAQQLNLANFHLDEKNFAEALSLFEKLNLPDKIYQCLIGIAEQEENTAPENAIEYYKKALKIQPNQRDRKIQLEIARLCEEIGDIPAAIEIYEQLNLPNKVYKCWMTLAHQAKEKNTYPKAIDCYEKALTYARTPATQQDIALELLPIAYSLIQIKENHQAKRASLLTIQSLYEPSQAPQKELYKIYLFLAKSTPENEYATITGYLQKALEIRPDDVGLILMKAELDKSHENEEQAIIGYERAIKLEPQKTSHKQKLIAAELAAGDKYYQKGVHDPQKIQETLVDYISEIRQADYSKDITNALGAWRGENSKENRELVGLGEYAETPQQIAEQGLRACELLESAYDGQANHMSPKDMPKALSFMIKNIKKSVLLMKEYYETLQKKTDELISEIKNSPMSAKFSSWQELPKIEDLKNAKYVESQAQKCLQMIDKAIQQNPSAATPALKQQIESLKQLCKPAGWINNAIHYYKKVLSHHQEYGQHCNNLIDAYTQIGDYANAIQIYEELKIKFPSSPLFIDYRIYAYHAADETNQIKLSSQQLVDGILKAADQFSREENYSDAVDTYLLAIKKASDKKQTADIALRLLDLGDKLIHTTHKDSGLTAYKYALTQQNILTTTDRLKPDRLFKTLMPLAEDSRSKNDYENAINYYEEAYKLKEDHELVNASLGSLYLEQNQPDKALSYLEKAHKINPKNSNYLNQIANAENAFADQAYAAGMTIHLRQSLMNLAKFVTVDAPYAENISNALGATWGWYSKQNNTLREIGKSAVTAKQVETESLTAITLLETAYDGDGYHNKPEDMPIDLVEKLKAFEDQLQHVQSSMKDNPQLYQKNIAMNTLEDQTQKAILYYEKAAARFPGVYNDNYNRMIDAYFLKGESIKALQLYNQLKSKFPTSPLYINPRVYAQTFDSLFLEKKYKDAYEMINTGIKEYPDNLDLRTRLSSLYFNLGQEAFLKNDFNSAVRLYTLATKCGADANVECYVNLAKIYLLADYGRAKINYNVENSNTSLYPTLNIPSFIAFSEPKAKEYPTYFQAAVANLKKAADISPNDAELRFQLTRIVHGSIEDINFDIIPYVEQATQLDPKNASYAYASLMTQKNASQSKKSQLIKNFKNAGGSLIGDDEAYWTMHNPRNFPL